MKSIKMALLGGAALAVTAAGAQADDLDALKAQIEALNARVAAMEATPSVPAGYQLLAISEGEQQKIPGLEMTSRDRFLSSDKVNTITVLPTADAPAGATITWSGWVRAGLVWTNQDFSVDYSQRANDASPWTDSTISEDFDGDSDDLDVYATGQLTVTATTDTAVGEIGVKIVMEANYDGIESESNEDIEFDQAWGYWSMTPELTFGGGYAGSLGNIGYGMDGACTCNYYDTIAFNPGDTSQMRLTYGSGPFSAAIALEDASLQAGTRSGILDELSDDQLGVAGEIKYSGDMFSGEISGVWRGLNSDDEVLDPIAEELVGDDWWQVGAGLAFGLGEVASISLAAAMGQGPVVVVNDNSGVPGPDISTNPWRNDWWGVSGIITGHLTDEFHAEIGAGYLSRDFDDVNAGGFDWSAESDRWVVAGGLYYNPVDQLTIGVEASYSDLNVDVNLDNDSVSGVDYRAAGEDTDTTIAFLSVWRF